MPLPGSDHRARGLVWLYLRFPLSFRDVEELLAERGIRVSYETVRCWVAKFGPQVATELRERERRPGRVWHLDEMAVRSGRTCGHKGFGSGPGGSSESRNADRGGVRLAG